MTSFNAVGAVDQALTDFQHKPGVIMPEQRNNLSTVAEFCPSWFTWVAGSKAPTNPRTGAPGKANDPSTAASFEVALGSIPTGGGVGVLMTDAKPEIVALDFDHVIEGGMFTPLGTQVVEQFRAAYVEVSPSGTGLRVFALGTVNTSRQRGGGVELYPAGSVRWLRMTGAIVKSTAGVVAPCQSGIDWAVGLLLEAPDKGGSAAPGHAVTGSNRVEKLAAIDALFEKVAALRPELEPEEVSGVMLRDTAAPTTSRARTLAQALKGNLSKWNDDESSADFFLFCEAVRRGCGGVEATQEVAEATKLKRDKWKEWRGDLTYLEFTVGNAVASVLTELEGKAARGKGGTNAVVDPVAVIALEVAGGVKLARTQGGKTRADFANIVGVLRHDPDACGLFAYDLFKARMYRVKSLVVLDAKAETETGPVTDDDYRRVALFLHSRYGWSAKLDDVRDAVKTVARDEKFDPVRDSLEKLALNWDGTKRLDDWLVRYLKIEDSDCGGYVRKVSRVSLIQSVSRVMRPGAKVDVMPVIIGPGGEGKGKVLQVLADAVGPGLYTNTGFDMSNTAHIVEKCAGRLVVEVAELDAIKRGRDVSAFKSAMTVLEDTHRKPWESESEDFPRRFTFWGTSNEDEFVTDASDGQGRRFWPLVSLATRDDPMDVQGLEAHAAQIWGEAVAAFKAGELSYIDHQADRAAAEQWDRVIERCRVSDPLDDAVDAYLMAWAVKGDGWRASAEIAKEVGLVKEFSGSVERKDFYRLADLLKARRLKKAKQGTFRGWVFTAAGLSEFRGRARGAGLLPRIESKGLKAVKKVA